MSLRSDKSTHMAPDISIRKPTRADASQSEEAWKSSLETTVEENSLRHAIVMRPWKYLWAPPIAWHDGHLRILECRPPFSIYEHHKPPSSRQSSMISSRCEVDLNQLFLTFSQIKAPVAKDHLLREIMIQILLRSGDYFGCGQRVRGTQKYVCIHTSR